MDRIMAEQALDIRLKRVYEPPEKEDGARVLIDRLWPRGLRKEKARLTLWLKDVAPSAELREWFGHDPTRFAEFTRRYRLELQENENTLGRIDDLLKLGRVTLLYAAHDTIHNQARVLFDYLQDRSKRHQNQ
jgi:uncharacterized protein YeaO (DUF488 family)